MKTKDLIRHLKDADPSGELECCVGNADILAVYHQPAYWDGCLQVLVRDKTKSPYYDVVGARYVSDGYKVMIQPLSVSDALLENPDLPVDTSGLYDSARSRYDHAVSKQRAVMLEIHQSGDRAEFLEYIAQRLAQQHGEDFERSEAMDTAGEFFDANLSWRDKMADDGLHSRLDGGGYPSWNSRRRMTWDRTVEVCFDGKKLVLRLNLGAIARG